MRLLVGVWLCASILHLPTCIAVASQARHNATWQPEYVLIATREAITRNCQTRKSVVFNGTSPGPAIRLKEGETTWVRVYNNVPNRNLTVHWHGLTMRTAPFSDGTPLVSQWPIPYRHFFDYEMRPDVGDAGTYFYHSHEGFQAVTAHGPLIVQDAAEPPYQYDDEFQLMIGDWYTKTDSEVESSLRSKSFTWPGGPESLVLNGNAGTPTPTSSDGGDDDHGGSADDGFCGLSVIAVKPETTYRVRWTSTCALAYAIVDIEDHASMAIIETDGRYTKPAETDHMQLGSGQRFSSLLVTKSQGELDADGKGGQYWINYRTPDGPAGYLSGKALLQYDYYATGHGNSSSSSSSSLDDKSPPSPSYPKRSSEPHHKHPSAPPHGHVPGKAKVSVDDTLTTWLEYTLEPLVATHFPTLGEVSRTLQINVTMDTDRSGMLKFHLNDLAWDQASFQSRPGAAPYLIDAYTQQRTPDYDAAAANSGWDPTTLGFPVRVGEVIDIVWQQTNVDPRQSYDYHPMHAHGERYWDLGAGSGQYDPAENEARFAAYTPAQRDTTMLYSYNNGNGNGNSETETDEEEDADSNSTSGWRAWRIRVTEENVGVWVMHCHVLHHMIMGMQTIWVFGDATTILSKLPYPYISGYLEYGGSAYGNDSYDPLVLSYFD